ncbi:MAG: hypothetical protein GX677_08945 [Treponema sp.]|nr:hypothetical protein [Treponema sp.]
MCMKNLKVCAIASDPIYIGTGGYTIGRVDNTIVRDPSTRIPKIPGSSIAGTMRFYMALELQSAFKDEYKKDLKRRKEIEEAYELLNSGKDSPGWMKYEGNKYALMKCAGQDENPNEYYDNLPEIEENKADKQGHCGHCIVCKTFGYSKNKRALAQQGIAFFSDLNILFFPVYTRFGVKWVTSPQILKFTGIKLNDKCLPNNDEVVILIDNEKKENHKINMINLGWINLPCRAENSDLFSLDSIDEDLKKYIKGNVVIVPDSLISHIINSNLEVRTSVSIDPLTGAAQEGALFTSEAIPRGTVFYGEIRLQSRPLSNNLPNDGDVENALKDASKYYESFGIGGMTTRGFGRMRVFIGNENNKNNGNKGDNIKENHVNENKN